MYTCEQLRSACLEPWPANMAYDPTTLGRTEPYGLVCNLHGRVVYDATGTIATAGPSGDDYTDHGLPGRAARGLLYWPDTRTEHVLSLLDLPAEASARDCARAMQRAGLSARAIADALYYPRGCGLSVREVAVALSHPEGCDLGPREVADALRHSDGAGRSLREVADAIRHSRRGKLSPSKIADALRYAEGCEWSPITIADAMLRLAGCNLSSREVAAALYAEDGCDLGPREVAAVLSHPRGCAMHPDDVRFVLTDSNGCGLSDEEAERALDQELRPKRRRSIPWNERKVGHDRESRHDYGHAPSRTGSDAGASCTT